MARIYRLCKSKKDRIDIVYMKSSEGRTWKDSYFETNYRNAKANGLKVRSISFLTATNVRDAEDQAKFLHQLYLENK